MGTFLNAGSEFLINNGYVDEGLLAGLENLANGGEDYTGVPQAYLNYILFDKEYNVIEGKKLQISEAGKFEIGDTNLGPHEHLQIDPITIAKEGYIYIYLSNQTPGSEVYLPARRSARLSTVGGDDLLITHTQGRVVQKDDYYPFGLSISGLNSSRENSLKNKYLYNGKELQIDFDLGWYDYGWRMYNPTIGRWNSIDPASELYSYSSPYSYVLNNPLRLIDPNGATSSTVIYDTNGDAWMVDCENGECDNARKMQHEITEKDTYYGLANRTYQGQFTVDDLRKWNPGIDENNLQIGQKINIIDSEQIKKDAIVRWIAQEIAIPGMVKADDPVVLNVISSNIDFSKFVWNDIKINSDNKLEGIGVLDHIVTPIVEKELKKRVARAFVKKGATTLTVRTASKLVAGTVGVTAGVIFNLLDPSTFGAQSFNEEDRSKRAYDALDLYIKVKSKEN